MNKIPSNGYGLDENTYDFLVEKIYGFEEFYYYKEKKHYNDFLFILNEIFKINKNVPMDESYKNAILGWFISFKNISRKLNTNCVVFKITNACQLKCKHCYQRSVLTNSKHMSYDEFLFLFDKHFKVANNFIHSDGICNEIVFEGGEATLNPELYKMINFVNFKNISATLLTNGIYIPDKVISALKKHPKNKVQISIDGLEKTHDFIRGEGTFKKSMSSIEILTNNNIHTYCNFVVNNKNFQDFLDLKDLLNLKNLELNVTQYTPQNKSDIYSLNKEELQFMLPYMYVNCKNTIGTSICNESMVSSIMETGDFLSCRRIMSDSFYSITNYFTDSEEESVKKIKKYAIRSRSVPVYCISCKNVSSCLGGMLCSRFREQSKFNLEDSVCHLLNKKQ